MDAVRKFQYTADEIHIVFRNRTNENEFEPLNDMLYKTKKKIDILKGEFRMLIFYPNSIEIFQSFDILIRSKTEFLIEIESIQTHFSTK